MKAALLIQREIKIIEKSLAIAPSKYLQKYLDELKGQLKLLLS